MKQYQITSPNEKAKFDNRVQKWAQNKAMLQLLQRPKKHISKK